MPTIQCNITEDQYAAFIHSAKLLGFKGIAPYLVSLATGSSENYTPYKPKITKVDVTDKVLQFIQRSEFGCSRRNILHYISGKTPSCELTKILAGLAGSGLIRSQQERRTRKTSTIYYSTGR